jgi:hypothetical protein
MPGPLAAAALTALIQQGTQAGLGALESRRREKMDSKQDALQDVLQSLSPQTQGQQPVRQGQGIAGQLQGATADPLVQKVLGDLIGKIMKSGESTARKGLPDASQALQAVAGSTAPAAAPSAGETAWVWPDGRPVTLAEANSGDAIPRLVRQTWQRKTPLPSGPGGGTQSFQRPGLLDPLLRKIRG